MKFFSSKHIAYRYSLLCWPFFFSLLLGPFTRAADKTEYVTLGSILKVEVEELGVSIEKLNKKPKVYLTLTTVKNNKNKIKSFPLKVIEKISKKNPVDTFNCEFRKKSILYNKKDYKNVELGKVLLAQPLSAKAFDGFFVLSKEIDKTPIDLKRMVSIAPPSIDSMGTQPEKAAETFAIKGKYFGTGKPKVLIEYYKGEKLKYKKCKIDKDKSFVFKNAQGKENKSCMKVLEADEGSEAVGYSELHVIYPEFDSEKDTCTGYVIIDNGIGLAAAQFNQAPIFNGIELGYSPDKGKVVLSWEKATDDDTEADYISYYVYGATSSTAAGVYQEENLLTTLYGQTKCEISNLTPGGEYNFLILAEDTKDERSVNRELTPITVANSDAIIKNEPKKLTDIVDTTISISDDESTITYKGMANEILSVGTVILLEIDGAHVLKKIDNFVFKDKSSVLTVSDAALNEIFTSGELHCRAVLTALEDSTSENSLARFAPAHFQKRLSNLTKLGFRSHLDPDGYFLISEKGDYRGGSLSFDKGIGFDYSLDFEPSMDFDVVWSDSGDESGLVDQISLDFGGKFTLTGTVSYSISGEATYSIEKKDFFQRTMALKYFIGTVPVFHEITLSLNAKLDLSAKASLELLNELSVSKTFNFGADWSKNTKSWTLSSEEGFSQSITFDLKDKVGLTGSLTVYPTISNTFYRMASADLSVKPELKLDVEAPLLSPLELDKFDFTFGVNGELSTSFSIFDKEMASWNSGDFEISTPTVLFSLPKVELTGEKPEKADVGDSVTYTASIENGVNNSVPAKFVEWSITPASGALLSVAELTVNEDGSLAQKASVKGTKAGEYKVDISVKGEGFLGDIGIKKSNASLEFEEEEEVLVKVEITSPADGAKFEIGEGITFKGSAELTNGSPVPETSMIWSIGGEQTAYGSSFSKNDFEEGKYTVTLSVTYGDNTPVTDSVTISVNDSHNIEVEISSPSDGTSFDEGESITFSGTAKDSEGTVIEDEDLVWSEDGAQLATGTSFSKSDFKTGDHTITLTATDADGETASASVKITIKDSSTVDIVGDWNFEFDWDCNGNPDKGTMTFKNDKSYSLKVYYNPPGMYYTFTGPKYEFDGEKISFTIDTVNGVEDKNKYVDYTGTVKDGKMSGTMKNYKDDNGCWEATSK